MKMGWVMRLILTISIQLLIFFNYVNPNEILGCGGFIKSHANIDFSKVEIKLLTKQGSLKDKTDCSPSNGYYFLPVYDNGEYILKISPPPGWSFEPQTVEFNFDGKTDICSTGKDVNFIFKGFGITGNVALAGSEGGVKGVNIELHPADGSEVRRTISDMNGVFFFTPIIPGNYTIKASHNKWYFTKSEYHATVQSGNTVLPENSLVVSGFDVQGKFLNNGQPLSSGGAVLFKEKGATLPSFCSERNIPKLSPNSASFQQMPICFATTDKNGEYLFKGVAPGKYRLKPIITLRDFKMRIHPEFIDFQVKRDSVLLKESFEITGFSISGKVLSSLNGRGVDGAKIFVNGHNLATTQSNGIYFLENIKPGSYILEVQADNMEFKKTNVKVSLSNPVLPDLIPFAFKACGKVISDRSHVVGISQVGTTFHITVSSDVNDGNWVVYLPNGKYFVEIITTKEEKAAGLQFFPLKHTLEINSAPVSEITFSQLKATLWGEVKCLADSSLICSSIEVTLSVLDSNGKLTGQTAVTMASDGKYSFTDVLPGPYELSIPPSGLCWESTTILLSINSAEEVAPSFVHKGYEVSVISSHKTIMQYMLRISQKDEETKTESIVLNPGANILCVPHAGEYSIELQGCHLFDYESSASFSTRDETPLKITAIAHKVGIRILSPDPNVPITLAVQSKSGVQSAIADLESSKVDGFYSYRFDTYLKPDEVITVKPQSNKMLFKPDSKELVGGNDCVDVAFNFRAIRGLIIQGKVTPPIKDVEVTLSYPENSNQENQVTMTSATGEFKFAPIDESFSVELSAAKESYVFSAFDRVKKVFKAHKLCDIVVIVKDDKGKLLNGVLLSLSGAESYRKNLVTGEDGTIKFHSLSPSQYFLRPMMKEYKFTPNSKMIDIKDGETVNVELIGHRVAFSAFGTITSLNGDPFPNVVIEVVSDEKCSYHQEESTTESSGHYRIRGLQPGCMYKARTKLEINTNVERSIPTSREFLVEKEDVRNVNLIAISRIEYVDVIGKVYTSSNEYYKTLRVQIYKKGSADSPLHSQRVESPLNTKARLNPGILVYFPRIPLDGKTYFVELKTTMSDRYYKLNLPVTQFIANASTVFVELNFLPELKAAESDLSQNSLSALFLVTLVAIAFFKQDLAMDLLNFIWNKANTILQGVLQRQTKRKDRYTETINYKEIEQIAEGINAIKKKKTKKI